MVALDLCLELTGVQGHSPMDTSALAQAGVRRVKDVVVVLRGTLAMEIKPLEP
jgi:hypothetical protein